MYYLLSLVNQDSFSIDKNQQNEYTELPTIAVIGLAGCCMLQALAYSWQEVFLDVISSEYIYICNKQGRGRVGIRREKRTQSERRQSNNGVQGMEIWKSPLTLFPDFCQQLHCDRGF